jgi:hypothetical protein
VNEVRLSILGVMAIVALAAVDCLALRRFYVPGSRSILLVGGLLPLVNLLAIGMFAGLRGLVARRRCPGFLVGFQAFGWTAAAAYAIAAVSPSAFDLAMPYLDELTGKLGLFNDGSSPSFLVFEGLCCSAALSAPLIAFGLVGGYLAHRSEIWLARGTWFTSGEDPPATAA